MAIVQLVTDGTKGAILIDGVGYGPGVDSIDLHLESIDGCTAEIKIGSLRSFRHLTEQEYHEYASRILETTGGST